MAKSFLKDGNLLPAGKKTAEAVLAYRKSTAFSSGSYTLAFAERREEKRRGEEREERKRNEEGIEKNVATVDYGDRSLLQFLYIYTYLLSHFLAH